jgi:hypothetical protein
MLKSFRRYDCLHFLDRCSEQSIFNLCIYLFGLKVFPVYQVVYRWFSGVISEFRVVKDVILSSHDVIEGTVAELS